MTRQQKIERKTSETAVLLDLNLDGSGKADLRTGLPFFEHMLELWCRHGFFDLVVKSEGDIEVDPHHLVEDTGLCMGKAFYGALGGKEGIKRYGFSAVPMDEALVTAAVDLSGRPWLHYEMPVLTGMVGSMDQEVFREFWQAFVNEGRFNLHLILNHGTNKHHVVEASFKAAARALNEASSLLAGLEGTLSTKGKLE
ncbi:MAG TPA: imidazoleglycerol-phosphate dehydratase HisB [Firmicutes bacterium]|nr:imidazoleglycerol-phosphate dehydratase HisB [Bacillota bacterium]